jgi:hypothetical protein
LGYKKDGIRTPNRHLVDILSDDDLSEEVREAITWELAQNTI